MATAKKLEVEVHEADEDSEILEAEEFPEKLEKRERKMTQKGLEYVVQVKRRRLEQIFRSLEAKGQQIQELIDNDARNEEVSHNYKRWVKLYDEFLSVDNDYRNLIGEDELEQYEDDWFTVRNQSCTELKQIAEEWFKYNSQQSTLPVKCDDEITVLSNSSRSSQRSSNTVKITQQQKKAELLVKTESLKKRRVLEESKLRLKHQEQELQLEEEIALSEACVKVLDDVEVKSTAQSSSSSCDHNGLMAVVRHLNKPSSDIRKFSGSPLEYHKFMRQFKSKVLSNCDDVDEQLNYLEQYTTGEANRIVTSYSYLDAARGYKAAIDELEERYGDPDVTVDAFVKRALTWPVINSNDSKALDEYGMFLSECENAVQSLDAIKVLEYSDNFKQIVSKLPYSMHDKWRSIVYQTKEKGNRVRFHNLVQFVRKEAKKSTDPVFGKNAMNKTITSSQLPNKNRNQKSNTHNAKSLASNAEHSVHDHDNPSSLRKTAFSPPCTHCAGPHAMETCERLSALPFYERTDVLMKNHYCFGCLKIGHIKRDCWSKATCSHCKGKHPSILHVDGRIPTRQEVMHKGAEANNKNNAASSSTNVRSVLQSHMGAGSTDVTMAIIPVQVKLRGSFKHIPTYAFYDPGSNVSFCSEKIMRQLGVSGKRIKLSLDTMGVQHNMNTYELNNIEICDLELHNKIALPSLYTKDKMPVSRAHIPTEDDIRRWPHLEGVTLPQIDSDIGLLIGNNIPDAYCPLDVRTGPSGSPHATRTRLGWVAWNVIRPGGEFINVSNRADVIAIERIEELKDLEIYYRKSLALDFPERHVDEKRENSVEDKKFLKKMDESRTLTNGHYQMDLPFKHDPPNLPDNKFQAVQRLNSLKKKLQANSQFHTDYTAFMNNILEKNFAEEVPAAELDRCDGKVWYLPHHGVYHARKQNKIRVVFDCSAKHRGISLNDVLYQGPDMTNNLIGVLMRFRQELVALMSDIECMYYQVKVTKKDCDCLRFFWWPQGNLDCQPVIYRMKVHLFGASSSPSCSNHALHQTVEDNKEYFSPEISEAVKSNFYVDDFLYSVPSEDEAISLIPEISFLCSLGGFHLTKWLSNSRVVLESIEESERAKGVKDLSLESFPVERALGVCWNIDTDKFCFENSEQNYRPTRRGILSTLSSIYDPLGLAAPVILRAKIILQEACYKGLGWDEVLPEKDEQKWSKWLTDLSKMTSFSVPRCLKPNDFGTVTNLQLHHFADASNVGYGCTSYIRYMNAQGEIACSLVLSRSRVAPLKRMTIPRMELTAAVVAVRMSKKICQELHLDCCQFYWTDSMSVIRYILNETTRFHTFVANRVAEIRDCTSTDEWRYIESKLNAADIASRGSDVNDLQQAGYWINAPDFLHESETNWPKQPDCVVLHENDPEIKQGVNVAVTSTVTNPVNYMLSRSSSWLKVKRTTAWILVAMNTLHTWAAERKLFKKQLQSSINDPIKLAEMTEQKMKQLKLSAKKNSSEIKQINLPVDMLEKAEMVLIRNAQHQFHAEEINHVSSEAAPGVKSSSSLYKLDPFVQEGILRVGGRLTRSSLNYDAKHQILIPHKSPLARLILQDVHSKVGHQGKNAMTAELRKRFWIPRVGALINNVVSRCVLCRRYRLHSCSQKMADLPANRVAPDEAPFANTGMDYFGPFHVKRGRVTIKRYGVLFTCFTSRAVHLEIAFCLDTDSCILAIRRFISRRGTVKSITSDNGTNLVGAERELRESIVQWNHSKIGRALHQQCIQWNFNPPTASHFGGVWERLIRMTRKVLYSVLQEQVLRLDDEGLYTVFCEVENILNSRPITPTSQDPGDVDAITPNDLLLIRPGQCLPCGLFDSSDNYPRRRWRQVQFLSDLFWRRWKTEYLHLLQERQKWHKCYRNLCVNDIVLVMDNTRNAWTMAKVVDVTKDKKGFVRIVKVKTSTGIFQRPVHELTMLLETELDHS